VEFLHQNKTPSKKYNIGLELSFSIKNCMSKNLKKSRNFADQTLLTITLEETIMTIGQKEVSKKRGVNECLNYAAHETSVS